MLRNVTNSNTGFVAGMPLMNYFAIKSSPLMPRRKANQKQKRKLARQLQTFKK